MAHLERWKFKDGHQEDYAMVTMAVGKNAPNKRDDVLLVQYLLKRIYEKPVYKNGCLSRPRGVMVVDGYVGAITLDWIKTFQLDMRTWGYSVLVDGRVDPSTGGQDSTISNTTYTIFGLGDAFKTHYPEIHANYVNHPDVPAEVRASLARRA